MNEVVTRCSNLHWKLNWHMLTFSLLICLVKHCDCPFLNRCFLQEMSKPVTRVTAHLNGFISTCLLRASNVSVLAIVHKHTNYMPFLLLRKTNFEISHISECWKKCDCVWKIKIKWPIHPVAWVGFSSTWIFLSFMNFSYTSTLFFHSVQNHERLF